MNFIKTVSHRYSSTGLWIHSIRLITPAWTVSGITNNQCQKLSSRQSSTRSSRTCVRDDIVSCPENCYWMLQSTIFIGASEFTISELIKFNINGSKLHCFAQWVWTVCKPQWDWLITLPDPLRGRINLLSQEVWENKHIPNTYTGSGCDSIRRGRRCGRSPLSWRYSG